MKKNIYYYLAAMHLTQRQRPSRTTDVAPRVRAFASELPLESDLSQWVPTEAANPLHSAQKQ